MHRATFMHHAPCRYPACVCTFADYFGLATLQPALPFYLATIGVDDVPLWAGIILSGQFAAVVLGNLVWGVAADRFGARKVLQITMVGDAIFFAATGFCRNLPLLIVVRVFAGLSTPLVPSLAYIFEKCTKEGVVAGMARYGFSVISGYMVAGAFVGAAYESLGWMVTSLITGAVAVVGFGVVTASEPPPPREPGQARPQSSGVRDAVKNPLFITFGVTCLTNGYLMMLMMNLLVFNLRDVFDFSAGQVGTVFIATTMIMIACSFYVVPRVSKRFGMRNTINGAGVAIIGLCVLLSLPFAYSHVAVYILLNFLLITSFQFSHAPNQARAKILGEELTVNGTGAITGISRTLWALGQAGSPVIALSLYSEVGRAAPFWSFAVLKAVGWEPPLVDIQRSHLTAVIIPLHHNAAPRCALPNFAFSRSTASSRCCFRSRSASTSSRHPSAVPMLARRVRTRAGRRARARARAKARKATRAR
mmetsp:Transcript_56320/g.155464  ORF Transcript_56320/g.155464 Transcript_56320/m.155464 type:complete len:477 (-) Transcript_56320:231-1661(-)